MWFQSSKSNLTSLCPALGAWRVEEKQQLYHWPPCLLPACQYSTLFHLPYRFSLPLWRSISQEKLHWGWRPLGPISPGFQLGLAKEEAVEMGWGQALSCDSSSSLLQGQDSHPFFSSSRRPSCCRPLCVFTVLCLLTIMSGVVKAQHGTSSRTLMVHCFWTTFLLWMLTLHFSCVWAQPTSEHLSNKGQGS